MVTIETFQENMPTKQHALTRKVASSIPGYMYRLTLPSKCCRISKAHCQRKLQESAAWDRKRH